MQLFYCVAQNRSLSEDVLILYVSSMLEFEQISSGMS